MEDDRCDLMHLVRFFLYSLHFQMMVVVVRFMTATRTALVDSLAHIACLSSLPALHCLLSVDPDLVDLFGAVISL